MGKILDDYTANNVVSDTDRKQLVKAACKFLMNHYGDYPSPNIQQIASQALVSLFTCLNTVSDYKKQYFINKMNNLT